MSPAGEEAITDCTSLEAPTDVSAVSVEKPVPDLARVSVVLRGFVDLIAIDCDQTEGLLADSVQMMERGFRNLESQSDSLQAVAMRSIAALKDPSDGRNRLSDFAGETDMLLAELVELVVDLSRNGMWMMRHLYRVSDRMSEVDAILGNARHLSDQTRLLSINASIEAAHAGSEGQTFAVVATEVKNLSLESRGFHRRIEELLSGVRSSTNELQTIIEQVASRDMNGTIERKQRVEEMMGHVAEVDETLSVEIDALSQASDGVAKVVAEIVRALQFEDMTSQIVSRQRGLLNQMRSLIDAMETGDVDRIDHVLEELEADLDGLHRSVTQQDMAAGEVELF